MNQPRTDVWADENDHVWGLTEDGTDEVRLTEADWPLRVWVTAADFREGNGWGRSRLEELVKVTETFRCNVKASCELYAALCEVPDEPAFAALQASEFEVADYEPERL